MGVVGVVLLLTVGATTAHPDHDGPPTVWFTFGSPAYFSNATGVIAVSGTAISMEGEDIVLSLEGGPGWPDVNATLVRVGFEEWLWNATIDTTHFNNGNECLGATLVATSGDHAGHCLPLTIQNPVRRDLEARDVGGSSLARFDVDIRSFVGESTNDARIEFVGSLEMERHGEWRELTRHVYGPGGSEWDRSFTWTPQGPIAGCFPVRLTVDPEDLVAEEDESNNVALGTACMNKLFGLPPGQHAPFDP